MTVAATLTSPLKSTFQVLGLRSNLASIAVLRSAISSSDSDVRLAALQTLVARGTEQDAATIVEQIDHCRESDIPFLSGNLSLLIPSIEAGLASRDSVFRQRSLVAIAKLKSSTQFHQLIQVAQSPEDPQQLVALQLLTTLASEVGNATRKSRSKSLEPIRLALLDGLWVSLESFSDHRVTQIADAWLCASHWEDENFHSIFESNHHDTRLKTLLRQFKHSHRSEVLALSAGVLWCKGIPGQAVQMLMDRKDMQLGAQLAALVAKSGVNAVVQKNLKQASAFLFLNQYDFSSSGVSIAERAALLQLFVACESSPDLLLKNTLDLLESGQNPKVEQVCANAIRGLRSVRPEILVMVLSDCFEAPDVQAYTPPPWKSLLQDQLHRLIRLAPGAPSSIRSAIETALSDFKYEELLKHFDDWPEPHLAAYGKLTSLADSSHIENAKRDLKSQSYLKRSQTVKAIRFLGCQNELFDLAAEALHDKADAVRIEAIYTIAAGKRRDECIELLRPFLSDINSSVKVAVNFAISQLEDGQ
jgi:HEAT repeat protein